MKSVIRSAMILLVIGTLVSAQQASSGGIVDCGDREIPLEAMSGGVPGFAVAGAMTGMSPSADTLETFDIEVEEESKGNLYKEIAIFVIVAAMVGYMVVQLINPGDEEEEAEPNGKDFPGRFSGISFPITP